MSKIKNLFKKTEKEKGVSIDMEKEAEFKEVPETTEEVAEETEQSDVTVEKGIVIYHDTLGNLRYQQLGDTLTLENITFYSRYLKELEKDLWKQKMAGEQNAEV